ncbi:hypothetical protein T4A_3139 [Trichinella pseudospiralis]|uniref:Uncharacterized protein n=1 Tax=Trichinella pseudospiralis TaxID=6337 RepID=A0A0V1IXD4_TRIPS|nr:hypothetical protein T4E_9162 [Trichinella pseudospiralis]KRY75842.1 hypothetical protein T4A_3139 [Trichinella pseudospiralis]KRZ27393.1 hypothetical protein T4C_13040 [Trichinella pseudospiralis]
MHHSLTNHILIFDIEADIKLLAQSDLLPVGPLTLFILVHQLLTLHVFKEHNLLPVIDCLTVRKNLFTYSQIFENMHCKAKTQASNDTRLFFPCLPSCTSSVQLVDRGYQNVQCCGIARVFPAEITAGYQNSTLGRIWCSHVSQKSSCRLA